MNCRINNNSNMNLKDLNPLIDDLASSVQQKVGFKSMPSITLQDDEDNADVLLGKTAYYDPQNKAVTVYVTNRHPKDILRSIAHELIHHGQNLRGEFDKIGAVGEGYAQNDEHLRNMEKEAYLQGNMCFRDWEDGYKRQMMESIHRQNSFKRRNNTMKKYNSNKNNELNKLLMEKFNFGGKKKEYDLEEGADRIFAPNHYCAHHVVHEGQEAYTVDHNWDEKLQEVTEYDIRFRDGTVKRNVSINELEVLEAFNESEHSGNRDKDGKEDEKKHPKVKKAKNKEEKVEEAMDTYGLRGNTGQVAGSLTVIPFGDTSLQPNGILNLNLAVMGKDGEYQEFIVRPKLESYEAEEIFEVAQSQTMGKDDPIYEKKESGADVTGDGKYTQKDKLVNLGVIDKDGNKIDKKKKKENLKELDMGDEQFYHLKAMADELRKKGFKVEDPTMEDAIAVNTPGNLRKNRGIDKDKKKNESFRRDVRNLMEQILKLK